ncbi:3040_t:CDS:10 [Entrophospora sp. SA101]|nr:3040_t:CDS:10 [Entrophospora sp. SA101]
MSKSYLKQTNNELRTSKSANISQIEIILEYFYSPLTEDQEKLIQSYSDSNILYDKVIEKFNMTVTYHDIKTLNPTVWVNDQVMNFYGKLIVDRNSKNKNLPSLFIHSTQFMTKYSSCGYKAVSKWTKKVDIFEKDLLFIPVHSRNMHWSLCLVDFKASKIYYIDSLYLTSEKYKEDVRLVINEIALTLCPLVGAEQGIEPTCYSRNIEIAGTLIFQPELLLTSGIIPTSSEVYPYFTAVHIGLITTTFWCLLFNGFIGFQFIEDGTPLSLWTLRLSSLFVFGAVTFLSVATFLSKAGLNPLRPFILWIILYVFNGAALVIYIVLQIVLVFKTLEDRWPLGDILFGMSFYAIGQVTLYLFSVRVCDFAKHYLDGLFFGTASTLLAVMMVYKYWDSVTKEDLEFSVGNKLHEWKVKELNDDDDEIPYTNAPGYSNPQQQYYEEGLLK